jgi:hypothetical protein
MHGHIAVRSVIIGFCVAVAIGPLVATAQQAERTQRGRTMRQGLFRQQQWWKNESVAAELGLTEQQMRQLDEAGERYREQLRSLRPRYTQTYLAFVETLSDHDASEESISQGRAAMAEAWSELMGSSIDQLLEVRSILNAEQWTKLPEVAPRALRLGQTALRG